MIQTFIGRTGNILKSTAHLSSDGTPRAFWAQLCAQLSPGNSREDNRERCQHDTYLMNFRERVPRVFFLWICGYFFLFPPSLDLYPDSRLDNWFREFWGFDSSGSINWNEQPHIWLFYLLTSIHLVLLQLIFSPFFSLEFSEGVLVVSVLCLLPTPYQLHTLLI